MTPRLADLPDDQRQAIERLVEKAPELTDRQRERLQLLFRQAEAEAGEPA
jgi:hypothetical protein